MCMVESGGLDLCSAAAAIEEFQRACPRAVQLIEALGPNGRRKSSFGCSVVAHPHRVERIFSKYLTEVTERVCVCRSFEKGPRHVLFAKMRVI